MIATDNEIVAERFRINQEITNQFLKKYLFANQTEKQDSNVVYIVAVTFLMTRVIRTRTTL
jgi:hypothetical protein